MKVQAGRVGKARPTAKARAKTVSRTKVASKVEAKASVIPAPAAMAEAFYLKLDPSCTLRETTDLQFSLVAAHGDPVVVDGGGVERIDTAGLQLLVALVLEQQRTSRGLEWKAASPELLKCGRRLGLLGVLGLEAIAGAAP